MNVTSQDFQFISPWTVDVAGEKWQYGEEQGQPRFLIDGATGKKYLNESKGIVGVKCFMLSLGTPLAHPFVALLNVVYRILKIVTFANFWWPNSASSTWKDRLKETGKDAARIVVAPFVPIALELASIYGWFTPYNGRKLYASIERAFYGNFIIAPCFQPEPTSHAFGGDIDRKDSF